MAAAPEERIAVPVDDPNADTEWYCVWLLLKALSFI